MKPENDPGQSDPEEEEVRRNQLEWLSANPVEDKDETQELASQKHLPPLRRQIDLHGMDILTAIHTVERFLNASSGERKCITRFIHGRSNKGPDSIKSQLHHLFQSRYRAKVKSFRLDKKNSGVTIVHH